jgi:uncharacterized protein (TIGR02145 family)
MHFDLLYLLKKSFNQLKFCAMSIQRTIIVVLISGFITFTAFSQVGINNDGTSPSNSAMLDVKSIEKGFLPPRMTTSQRDNISNPQEGLIIFNTDIKTLNIYDGVAWVVMIPENPDFTCGHAFTDYRNGKVYNTVLIGSQCWMKENLNVGTKLNVSDVSANNGVVEKYCYNDLESNCDIYGGLYQWNEMMNYTSSSFTIPSGRQGICPTGWHIPSIAEWCQTITYLEPGVNCIAIGAVGTVVGGILKETGYAHWANPNNGATNSSGFTGLPGGTRNSGASYYGLSLYGYFWTSAEYTDYGSNNSWYFYLDYYFSPIYENNNAPKVSGMSVRCVKDI